MKQYLVVLEGINLFLKGTTRPLGCFTTRVVTANDNEEAFQLAVEDALAELNQGSDSGPLMNAPLDPPTWLVDEITEHEGDESVSVPRKGFTFYAPDLS